MGDGNLEPNSGSCDEKKLRELDPGRCLETDGIAPDGVRKEVAGGVDRRKKQQPGK